MLRTPILFTSIILVGATAASAADVNWVNSAGGDWFEPTNWSTGGLPDSSDTAVFGTQGVAPGTAVVVELTTRNDAVDQLVFSAIAAAFTVQANPVRRRFSNVDSMTIDAAVTQDQQLIASIKHFSGTSITNNSASTFTFRGDFFNDASFTTNILNFDVAGIGDVVFEGDLYSAQRTYAINKTGDGNFDFIGTYDFQLGDEGGDLVKSLITVAGGKMDISQMVLNLDNHNTQNVGTDYDSQIAPTALEAGQTYTVVDYSAVGEAGLITNTGSGLYFESVRDLPDGWTIADTGSQIVLQEVPEPGSFVLIGLGGLAFFGRKRS